MIRIRVKEVTTKKVIFDEYLPVVIPQETWNIVLDNMSYKIDHIGFDITETANPIEIIYVLKPIQED